MPIKLSKKEIKCPQCGAKAEVYLSQMRRYMVDCVACGFRSNINHAVSMLKEKSKSS